MLKSMSSSSQILRVCAARARRGRIRSQYPQPDDELFEFLERRGDHGIAPRCLQIQIKTVLPRLPVNGAALDLQQVQVAPRERLQRVKQSAGTVIELKNQRKLVGIAGRRPRGFVRRLRQ